MASIKKLGPSSINDSYIYSDLTCPLCFDLYDTPKIMPGCAHSFCLKCLCKLKLKGPSIKCPDCGTESKLNGKGVEDFPTNVVVQRIADKMRTASPAPLLESNGGSDVCVHLTAEAKEKCMHCELEFCNNCKYRHMETIKEEVASILKTREETGTVPIGQLIERADAVLKNDLRKLSASLDTASQSLLIAVVNVFRDKVREVNENAKRLADGELERLRQYATSLGNADSGEELESVKERLQRMTVTSIFKQQMNDFAQVYLDISKQKEAIDTFKLLESSIGNGQLLAFKPSSSLGQFRTSLSQITFGDVEIATNCQVAQPNPEEVTKVANPPPVNEANPIIVTAPISETCEEKVKTLPMKSPVQAPAPTVLAVSKKEPKLVPAKGETPPINSSGASAAAPASAARNVKEVPITRLATRIIALPTQGLFAVLSVSKTLNRLTLFKPSGEIVDAIDILNPGGRFVSFIISDIATDYRSTIFATAVCKDQAGAKTKAICRFWLNEGKSGTEPELFALGRDRLSNQFKGLAISTELKMVFTTEAESIIAYESINLPRNQYGWPVARWHLGPNPYLHAIEDDYGAYYSLKLLCSKNGEFWSWTIFPAPPSCPRSPSEGHRLIRVMDSDIYHKLLPVKSEANEMCTWSDGNAIVCKDGMLDRYVNIHQFAVLSKERYPANLLSNCPAEIKGVSILELTKADSKHVNTFIAVLYPSEEKRLAFAELTDA